MIGTAATFVLGYLFSLIEERGRRQKPLKRAEAFGLALVVIGVMASVIGSS